MKAFKLFRNGFAVVAGGLFAVLAVTALQAIENSGGQSGDETYELVDSNSLFGSYLAGRLAHSERDNVAAVEYFREALEKDPNSREILEETFQLRVATGQFSDAHNLARLLIERDKHQKIPNFFLGISSFLEKRYSKANKYFKNGSQGPIMDLTGNLSRAWVEAAQGDAETALKFTKNTTATPTEISRQIELLHRALIADVLKKREIAKKAYAELYETKPRAVRAIEAYVRHAVYWGDKELAQKVLAPHVTGVNPNPLLKALSDDIAAGKKIKLLISTPQNGLAEVFQGIGEALSSDQVLDAGQVYLQLALMIRPKFVVAYYALGELYDQQKNYKLAAEMLGKIPESSPLWLGAQMRSAYDFNALERLPDAKKILEKAIAKYPKDMRPYYTLGTILRANKKFKEAIPYFTQTIERMGTPEKSHWSVYYARGVCYERIKNWSKAEVDLQKALKLDPNQGLTLNYLGYSWVDQGTRVKEGMELILRAVQLRPNDGYFIDSLGWAYYRQHKYNEAVKHLERAVELKPEDPVINDHLGDAFWRVGRKLEANYQWKQALSLKPEPDDEKRIKKKIETGVLIEPSERASLENPVPSTPAQKTK
jgi:tetratricopeptide (TPR) repeat protein